MTDHREVMRQALAVLTELNLHGFVLADHADPMTDAIEALRAALDEPAPEPVAMVAQMQRFLNWNRSQEHPPVNIGSEYRAWEGAMKFAHPAAPHADTITVRLTREQHSDLVRSVICAASAGAWDSADELALLQMLGTFPDAEGK